MCNDNKFVVGQKVKCIFDGGTAFITTGKIYKILDIDEECKDIKIICDDNIERYILQSRFEAIKEKTMKNYEIIKPFTILDIYDNLDFTNDNHKKFYREIIKENWNTNYYWRNINVIKEAEWLTSIKENLDILEEIGLIKEKDVVLKPGMKLENSDGVIYHVVESGDGNKCNRISLYCEGHEECDYGFIWNFGKSYRNDITINELNKKDDVCFQVIND